MTESHQRLHIIMNAADGFALFDSIGIRATTEDMLTSPEVHEAITSARGLFRLLGWDVQSKEPVTLQLIGYDEHSLTLKNRDEPPFLGTYRITESPVPQIAVPMGDIIFELEQITIEP